MLVGERIRQLREKKRWSQEQLSIQARRFSPDIKLARETVSRLENGRNAPDLWVIESLCKVFGVSLSEFFSGVDLSDAAAAAGPPVDFDEEGLDPEVEDLARRVSALPADRRARVVGLAEEFLALLEEEPVEASLSEMQREMLAYFDELNETNQEIALARLREILGEGPAQSDERRGARGTA